MAGTELFLLLLIQIVGYIVVGIRLMRLCDASGVSLGWFAFVPLLNFTRWARLAGKNPWLVLLWIIPIVGLILALIWLHRIASHTQSMQWFWIMVVAWIGSGVIGGALGSSTTLLLLSSIVFAAIMVAAQWMIFDPAKPIRTGGETAPAAS
jgi:hypothetical protein